jgi:hypothetical protein
MNANMFIKNRKSEVGQLKYSSIPIVFQLLVYLLETNYNDQ